MNPYVGGGGGNIMVKRTLLSLAVMAIILGESQAADPIVGNWTTQSGQTATISPCGGGFCVTLKTGQYAGKKIGSLTKNGKRYVGKVTDPANDKTYNGRATLNGRILKMSGCLLGGLFCRSQEWTKQ